MIKDIEIRRLRGIRAGAVRDLSRISILVGPNGSGKSTVLDALLMGASPVPTAAVGIVVRRRSYVDRAARWLYWRLGGEGGVELVTHSLDGARAAKRTRTFAPLSPGNDLEVVVTDSTDSGSAGRLVRFEDNNVYNADRCRLPVKGVSEVRFVEAAGKPRTPLHKLYTDVVEQGRRRDAKALLESVVPGLEDIEILTDGDRPVVHLVFDSYSIPVGLAGDGTQALIHLSLELAARRGGVVLAEEPEVHMHPAAIRQCARAIVACARREVQIVLSTHSLELIDALVGALESDAEFEWLSVFRMALEVDGELRVTRVPGAEVAEARTGIVEDLR